MRCKSDCGIYCWKIPSSFICCAALQHKKWFYCDAIEKVRSYFCIHLSLCLSALKTGEVFSLLHPGFVFSPGLETVCEFFSA